MEERYSFAVIAKATGMNMRHLEDRRRISRVSWHPKGYTLAEVKAILGGYPTLPKEEIGSRARKALELAEKLAETEG